MKPETKAVKQAIEEMGPIGSTDDVTSRARRLLTHWRRGSPRIVMPRVRACPVGYLRGYRPRVGNLPTGESRQWHRDYLESVSFTSHNMPHPSGWNRAQRRAAERAGERLATVGSVEESG